MDVFGPSIQLYVGKEESYRTWYGVFATLFYTLLMSYAVVWEAQGYLSTESPLSVHDSFTQNDYPLVSLPKNKILPLFLGYFTETDQIYAVNMSKYFTFVTQKIVWNTTTDDSGQVGLQKIMSYFDTVPCAELTDEEMVHYDYLKQSDYIYSSIAPYGICVKTDSSYYVQGKGSDDVFEVITLRILPCTLPDGCATLDEMKRANFVLVLPESNVNPSNFEIPHSLLVNADDIYYINPNIRQIYTSKIQENRIQDYLGLINQNWVTRTTYYDISSTKPNIGFRNISRIHCTAEEIYSDVSDCQAYYEFTFQSSGTVLTLKRSYVTIMGVFGDLGGFNAIIGFFIFIFYNPLNKYLRNKYLVKQLYGFLNHTDVNGDSIYFYQGKAASSSSEINDKKEMTSKELEIEGNKSLIPMTCRKKNKSQQQKNRLESAALEQIESSLDILNIIKELTTLKVLTHLLLRPRHMGLAPLIGFKAFNKEIEGYLEKETTKKRRMTMMGGLEMNTSISTKAEKESSYLKYLKMKHNSMMKAFMEPYKMPVEEEEDSYSNWMEEIRGSLDENEKTIESIKENMDKLTDDYYKQLLVQENKMEKESLPSEGDEVQGNMAALEVSKTRMSDFMVPRNSQFRNNQLGANKDTDSNNKFFEMQRRTRNFTSKGSLAFADKSLLHQISLEIPPILSKFENGDSKTTQSNAEISSSTILRLTDAAKGNSSNAEIPLAKSKESKILSPSLQKGRPDSTLKSSAHESKFKPSKPQDTSWNEVSKVESVASDKLEATNVQSKFERAHSNSKKEASIESGNKKST